MEEQWRVEVEWHRAEEQAKKHVSHLWLVMMELMVLHGGGHCITAQQGQDEGIGAASVQPVCGV